MTEIANIFCNIAVELYKQVTLQTDTPEDLESVSIDAESKDGYTYKITISRTKAEGSEADEG